MLPRESVERNDRETTNAWRSASWNAGSSSSAFLKVTNRFAFLHNWVQMISKLKRQDPYEDTGESGEAYDAEMEAAVGTRV